MRHVFGAAVLAAAALVTVSTLSIAHAIEVSPPDEKSGAKTQAQGISGYDYMRSSGAKQVRLKMENVGNEKVYSSFIDGVLVANARVPMAPMMTDPDTTNFNQYIRSSSDAITQAGVDPKALGLT